MAAVIRLHHDSRRPLGSESILPTACMVTAVLMLMALPVACAVRSVPTSAHQPGAPEADLATYRNVKALLDKDGAIIDYDTLLEVYGVMAQPPRPIAHPDLLIRQLINERNAEPRIDQMILIFAAKIMGSSRHSIPGAQKLFESILEQDERINQWVLSYVAEAVADYAFGLPRGSQLVDAMEAKLSRIVSEDRSGKEDFGRHFLPPPKSDVIRNYLNGIGEQAQRQSERFRYYVLISNNWTEEQIASALTYLQAHGVPGSGERCPLLMQCLLRFRDRLPLQ